MSQNSHAHQAGPQSLWTADDVAAYLRCSKRHVANLCKAGLPHFYLGRLRRFRQDQLEAFLARRPRLDLRNNPQLNALGTAGHSREVRS